MNEDVLVRLYQDGKCKYLLSEQKVDRDIIIIFRKFFKENELSISNQRSSMKFTDPSLLQTFLAYGKYLISRHFAQSCFSKEKIRGEIVFTEFEEFLFKKLSPTSLLELSVLAFNLAETTQNPLSRSCSHYLARHHLKGKSPEEVKRLFNPPIPSPTTSETETESDDDSEYLVTRNQTYKKQKTS